MKIPIEDIAGMFRDGYTQAEIAKETGIPVSEFQTPLRMFLLRKALVTEYGALLWAKKRLTDQEANHVANLSVLSEEERGKYLKEIDEIREQYKHLP